MSGKAKSSYEHSKYMGRTIADVVLKIWDECSLCENTTVKAGMESIYNRTRTDGIELYEEKKQFLEDYYAGKIGEKDFTPDEMGEAKRIVATRAATVYRRLPMTVISFGKAAVVGFGGEPFTHYATAVREACPERFLIAVCCANGGEGYLPTAAAFTEGGYEANYSHFSPTLEDECVSATVKLLEKL